MLPETQQQSYKAFYDASRDSEILEKKTRILLALVSAMAFGCYPWMEHCLSDAKENGITDDEIGAAQAIVMSVSAGRINAQFKAATGF